MRTAQDPADAPKLARWAVSIKESVETAAVSWSNYRNKRDPALLGTVVDELKNICIALQMIAKVLGMELTPFRAAASAFEDFQVRVLSGKFDVTKYGPGQLGKVTLALRDMRMASRELVGDVRDLRSTDTTGYDYMAFGADLSIIAGALVPAAKALHVDVQGLLKMRNALAAHFRVISDNVFESTPPGGPAVDVPAESIVFATWAKRASIEVHRNPVKAAAMLDGILKALER